MRGQIRRVPNEPSGCINAVLAIVGIIAALWLISWLIAHWPCRSLFCI